MPQDGLERAHVPDRYFGDSHAWLNLMDRLERLGHPVGTEQDVIRGYLTSLGLRSPGEYSDRMIHPEHENDPAIFHERFRRFTITPEAEGVRPRLDSMGRVPPVGGRHRCGPSFRCGPG